METTAYLVMPLSGPYGAGLVDLSVPHALQILEDLDQAALGIATAATESKIRILPFGDLPADQRMAVSLSASTPFLAAEMPAPVPASKPAIRRASISGVSWHDPNGAFSTQVISEREVLIAACVATGPGEDVTLPFHRLVAVDPIAALSLAGGTYERTSLVDLPRLGCGSLAPRCLEPLLDHPDRQIREEAIGMLGWFKH